MSDEWLTEDPFADPEDPRARERAERRAERERKRQVKAEKEGTAPPPPEPPKPPPPSSPKRSPEQEFWDEDPEPAPKPPESKPPPAAAATGADTARPVDAAGEQADGERKWSRFRRKHRQAEEVAPAAAGATAGAAAAEGAVGTPAGSSEPAASPPPPEPRRAEAVSAPTNEPTPPTPSSGSGSASPEEPMLPGRPSEPATSDPPKEQRSAKPPKDDRPADSPKGPSPAAPLQDPVPATPPPTVEQSLPTPVPAPDDPTKPATGDHLVPDPDAPDPTREHSVAAGAAAGDAAAGATPDSGQTSEEWAAAPAAQGDWEDFAAGEYHDEGRPEMAGAARVGRRHGDDGGRRGGPLGSLLRHPFRIAALLVLIVILWFLNSFFQPFHGDGHGRVAVRIPKGASVSEVGELLEKKGVISGGTFGIIDGSTLFQLRTALAGKRSDLISGPHVLKKDMSYGDAIDALSKEPSKKAVAGGPHEVTIPEGYTRGQAAAIIREDGVPGNYKKATVKSKFLDPAEYGGKKAKNLEGFLFPDTFQLKRKAPVKALVQLQLEDFKRRIKKVNMKYANSKNLTIYDVVTIASMIEREAGVAKQRKLVASVIYNRLHEGIPLGIDATIRFAVGNYEKPLTQTQLETDSPYNTRLNQGLPPGPINSPGLAALQAAAHPADTEFIYYVNNPDSCNELTFAKTEAEFEEAVQKYEKAREANNGNAPSTCG